LGFSVDDKLTMDVWVYVWFFYSGLLDCFCASTMLFFIIMAL
jgi:hypothetical protein